MTAKVVLAVSGALGFVVVAHGFPEWQVAVETAQVTAGLVDYPSGNPFLIYHLKLWTVLHHLGALLLLAGVSEITLSIALSGVIGMVTFQALSMFIYALSRDAVLALTATIAIIVSNTANVGVGYPIFLLGTSHTYGALGLTVIVLTAALVGSGLHGAGLFLLGVAPAVHPGLGIWLALIAAIAFVLDRRHTWIVAKSWRFFVAGCAISAVSLAVQLVMAREVPSVPASVATKYVAAFTALWDGHRQPVTFSHMGVRLTLGALAVAALALVVTGRGWANQHADGKIAPDLLDDTRFLLRFIVVTGIVGAVLVVASWIPPARLPRILIVLMPTRLLNVTSMTFGALVIGLLGACSRWWWTRWATVALALLLIVGRRSLVWEWMAHRGWPFGHARVDATAVLSLVALLGVAVAAVMRWRNRSTRGAPAADTVAPPLRMTAAHTVHVVIALAVVWIASEPVLRADERATLFRDRTNDTVLAAAARGRGLLLTGGDLHLVQLRTRRPVLLPGGGLDGLAYAPESAPALDQILRDVYEIDLFNPPEDAHRRGAVPPEFNRQVWQGYAPERWAAIKGKYNVTQILVPADWNLTLPVVAYGRRLLLYDIP